MNFVEGRRSHHPSDEDLSLGTPGLHPCDEDLSLGTPGAGARVDLCGLSLAKPILEPL